MEKVILRDGPGDLSELKEYLAAGGFAALREVLGRRDPSWPIAEVKSSGLRGCGGAGFPAGVKWEAAARMGSAEKYVVCNADEGEPGTFKDREILERNPYLVLEAMVIAGYAVGASRGYIYIRYEYPEVHKVLALSIQALKGEHLLGRDIIGSGFSFDITLRRGAGAYICGEEMGLLNSLEGKRGVSEMRPPYPTERGLFGKPTVINNVETLAFVPAIIVKGAKWFQGLGRNGLPGNKIYSLSGKVMRPGNYELPLGVTARELIYEHGAGLSEGSRLKAFFPGGVSSAMLPGDSVDVALDFDSLARAGSMLGSGGVIVMDERACMVDVTKQTTMFFMDESCGKCTPCQIGTRRMYEILDGITRGAGSLEDLELIVELSRAMVPSSICGLGQAAPNPVLAALKHFRWEFDAHVGDKVCPAGFCSALKGRPDAP